MTHDSEGCCVQRGKYLRRGATLFLAAAGDSARAASCKRKDLHGSVGDTWLHHHKETKQTKLTDRITERSRSRGRCERAMPRLSIPSMERHSPFHFVYFPHFSSRLIGCPHNHCSRRSQLAPGPPRTDTYAAMASGQWPPMVSISSGHISSSSRARAVFYQYLFPSLSHLSTHAGILILYVRFAQQTASLSCLYLSVINCSRNKCATGGNRAINWGRECER